MDANVKSALLRTGTSVSALLMAVSLTGTALTQANASKVHSTLGTSPTKLVTDGEAGDTEYFKSDFASWEDAYDHAKQVNVAIQEEGSVLLKNDGALPMASGAKVSLFSYSSANIVYGGSGSGSIDTSKAPTLKAALEDAGFQVNNTLWDYYSGLEKPEVEASDDITPGFSAEVFEPSPADFPADVKASCGDYNDAAIVVLSHAGGEGSDLNVQSQYLELQNSERELLDYVQQNFSKVIVLLNSSNALAMDWVDDYNIDSILWIGGPGQEGLHGVANILNGTVSPSGKLADIYAKSSLSAPAMQNCGAYQYTNATVDSEMIDFDFVTMTNSKGETTPGDNSAYYIVEPEGIYIGYKYYETRYEDTILGQGNANGSAGVFKSADNQWNYADEVAYSFGYGLSYTTFAQTLDSVERSGDDVTVNATVKNTGSTYSGKDVVEVYAQAPYIAGGIEKASVQLVGFAKTDVLAPGESQQVTINVSLRDVASFDEDGTGAYVLDAGTYYFAIGNGAHDALNNILAAKGKTVEDGMDSDGTADKAAAENIAYTVYDTDENSGNEIKPLFEDADLNYWQPDTVTYLTRNDWQGTWPISYDTLAASDEMIAALQNNYTANPSDGTPVTYGVDSGVSLVSLKDVSFDDDRWNTLLDQMTMQEQVDLVTRGCEQTAAISSIGFKGTVDKDGPAGLTGRYYEEEPGNDKTTTDTLAVGYSASVVIASTWSTDMAYARGASVGEDGLWTDTEGWWGPACNTHSTPYSGRNFEYYSEDAYLGGMIGAADISGGQSKGIRPFMKHFALNDSETQRHGLSTFASEQAMREIYLRQFEYVIKQGNVLSLMSSFNRIGLTWAGGDPALCTDLLRNEWGFQGSVETDLNFFFGSESSWMNPRSGLRGGNDQWLGIGESNLIDYVPDDVDLQHEIREACHRILYSASKTAAMNGASENSHVVKVLAWWQTTLYAMDVVFSVLAVAYMALVVLDEKKRTSSAKKG